MGTGEHRFGTSSESECQNGAPQGGREGNDGADGGVAQGNTVLAPLRKANAKTVPRRDGADGGVAQGNTVSVLFQRANAKAVFPQGERARCSTTPWSNAG